MSDKAETMELKINANRGEWVATVHTARRTAPWIVKLGEKFYVRTSEPGESSFVYDHAERPLSETEVGNAFDANLSVEVSRVEYAGIAETVTCENCHGKGAVYRSDLEDFVGECPTCSGTGVRTTGEVVGVLPETPDPVTDESCRHCNGRGVRSQMQDGTLRIFACECRLPPNVRLLEYIHSPEVSGVFVSDQRDATIAALTTDRDVLRLEVQRLKDLNFESQDLYAAIEAERDELRARVDELFEQRNEAVRRAETITADWRESHKRAESYLRVIEAQSDMIELQERHNAVALRLAQAYSAAGFATDVLQVADVPIVKEADNA